MLQTQHVGIEVSHNNDIVETKFSCPTCYRLELFVNKSDKNMGYDCDCLSCGKKWNEEF